MCWEAVVTYQRAKNKFIHIPSQRWVSNGPLLNGGGQVIIWRQYHEFNFLYLWVKRWRLKPELLYAGKHRIAGFSFTVRRLRVRRNVSGEFFLGHHVCVIWWCWNRNGVSVEVWNPCKTSKSKRPSHTKDSGAIIRKVLVPLILSH